MEGGDVAGCTGTSASAHGVNAGGKAVGKSAASLPHAPQASSVSGRHPPASVPPSSTSAATPLLHSGGARGSIPDHGGPLGKAASKLRGPTSGLSSSPALAAAAATAAGKPTPSAIPRTSSAFVSTTAATPASVHAAPQLPGSGDGVSGVLARRGAASTTPTAGRVSGTASAATRVKTESVSALTGVTRSPSAVAAASAGPDGGHASPKTPPPTAAVVPPVASAAGGKRSAAPTTMRGSGNASRRSTAAQPQSGVKVKTAAVGRSGAGPGTGHGRARDACTFCRQSVKDGVSSPLTQRLLMNARNLYQRYTTEFVACCSLRCAPGSTHGGGVTASTPHDHCRGAFWRNFSVHSSPFVGSLHCCWDEAVVDRLLTVEGAVIAFPVCDSCCHALYSLLAVLDRCVVGTAILS
jgi:hypothetical protein